MCQQGPSPSCLRCTKRRAHARAEKATTEVHNLYNDIQKVTDF